MVWIHGGGFGSGSGSEALYDGGFLAARCGVVVVTIHYRLVMFGFGCPGDAARSAWGAKANTGLLDQVQALRWVQGNIRAFGGDPSNVTVFGESAGSAAVACLLTMPAARGLFHKAIMQSGAGDPAAYEAMAERSGAVFGSIGVDPADANLIRSLAPEALVRAGQESESGTRGCGLTLDPETLPGPPMSGEGRVDVPLLIGTNRDESRLFNVFRGRPELGDAELVAGVGALCAVQPDEASSILRTFRDSRAQAGLGTDNHALYDAVATVRAFRLPSARFATVHRALVYQYLFDWESPAMRGALGSCHALEMPFVFGTLSAPTQDRFAGTGEAVRALAGTMMDAWSAFARSGDPTTGQLGWQPYTQTARKTMRLGREFGMGPEPFAVEREVLEPYC